MHRCTRRLLAVRAKMVRRHGLEGGSCMWRHVIVAHNLTSAVVVAHWHCCCCCSGDRSLPALVPAHNYLAIGRCNAMQCSAAVQPILSCILATRSIDGKIIAGGGDGGHMDGKEKQRPERTHRSPFSTLYFDQVSSDSDTAPAT